MALGSDILRLIIDADSSGAVSEFKKLGKDIDDVGDKASTGFKGKLTSAFDGLQSKSSTVSGIFDKIGMSSSQAAGVISAAIPAAGVAAAAGLVAFAAKGVQAFQETALAAGKFADSTGLSVESASKYIAVADDIGVGASTIQGAFVKMEKAMATNRTAFGDLVATTKSGGVDLDQTFLNVITHLQGIKDPIERANESSKLFGRGFAEVSQIIGTDADTLKKKLADVSKQQVITQAELEKARNYQAAMDNLKDSVGDLSRTLGSELVSSLATAANAAAGFVNVINMLPDAIANSILGGAIGNIAAGWDAIFGGGVKGAGEVKGALDGIDLSKLEAGTVSAGGFGDALQTAAAKANDLKTKWDLLKGSLSVQDAQLSLEDGFAAVATAAQAAWDATSSGAADASAKVNDHKQSVVNLEQKVVDYGEKVLGLPPEVVSDILAKIDEGDLAGAQAALDKAAEDRKAAFKAKEDTGATSAVEKAFETAARQRSALMQAEPTNVAGASGALDGVAHSRQASISAEVSGTAAANNALDNVARTRVASIQVQVQAGMKIPKIASGTQNFPGGVALVGEQGPELTFLPKGTAVKTAAETRQIMAGPSPMALGSGSRSSGGNTINVVFSGLVTNEVAVGKELKRVLAKAGYSGVS